MASRASARHRRGRPWRRTRLWQRLGPGDRGSAIVEFVFFGVLVTLPVFYLVVALTRVHAGAYAVSTAARESGRTFVTAPSEAAAGPRARAASAIAFEDQGFGGEGDLAVSCSARPCLTRDAAVRTRTQLRVPLPFVPGFMSDVFPTGITVSAEHEENVDRFAEAGR